MDLKLVDSLFGMYGGYVLNFSNNTFASFFAQDIGVDIYDDAYTIHGTSKGKRLWAFLEVGQTNAVIKALSALWEIREIERSERGESDKVFDGRNRLNALLAKLGGRPIGGAPTEASPSAGAMHAGPTDIELTGLEGEFMAMHAMEDSRQARGYAFERFLKRWFDAWGLDARGSFKLVGEQIDGSFEHRGSVYLIEAKWTNSRTDAAALRSFQEKAGDGFEGTRGLFVSYAGFTEDGLKAFNAKRVILMDGMDVYEALRRRISLDDVIAAKFRRGTEERRPWIQVRELFP